MQSDRFSGVQSRTREVDAGLRAHMNSIYNRMSLGILITAITSWIVSSSPALLHLFLGGPQAYIVMLAPLGIIWFGFNPRTMSSQRLQMSFFALSVLYGISLSVIALAFAGADIARAFFVSAGTFAALSVFGYTTKKNLQPIGAFCFMAFIGLVIVSLIGIFFTYSHTVNMFLDMGIILVISGLTAWETQEAKQMYRESNGAEVNSRMAWVIALNLYLNFIILFTHILNLMQQR